jgi:hypothetical protein
VKAYLAVFMFVLMACAAKPQTPEQGVYAAKQSYAIALSIAVAYRRLPVCGGATALCAKPELVATLQKLDDATAALLDGAENTVRMEGSGVNADTAVKAANEAVAAFTTITAVLNTGAKMNTGEK